MKRIIVFSLGFAALAGSCAAADAPPSAVELGCTNCHALEHKIVGPSWIEISRRYADRRTDAAVQNQLVKSVSNGSEDRWGTIPMVANDPAGKKREQIIELVKYILSVSEPAPETQRKN